MERWKGMWERAIDAKALRPLREEQRKLAGWLRLGLGGGEGGEEMQGRILQGLVPQGLGLFGGEEAPSRGQAALTTGRRGLLRGWRLGWDRAGCGRSGEK